MSKSGASEGFDEAVWSAAIQHPDWYVFLQPALKLLRESWRADPASAETRASKRAVIGFFERALRDGSLSLAHEGPDLDAARLPIDTVVIHHTSRQPGYTKARLNAVQMLNIYVPYFLRPTGTSEESLQGQPLWSNHVQNGRQVFYAYHWLLRIDGRAERLLGDEQIGWHAGNWEINRRSVAICLDNDYEKHDPDDAVLERLAAFIKKHYPRVSAERIFGHCEVSKKPTICPGGNFAAWKSALLARLR